MSTQRKCHTLEQIVLKLGQADRLLGEGKAVADVCRELGVAEQTYYRCCNQYGGMKADDAKQLKELEKQNTALKRLLAEQEPLPTQTEDAQEVIRRQAKEIRELRISLDILTSATAFFGQVGVRPSTDVVVAFIDDHRHRWGSDR